MNSIFNLARLEPIEEAPLPRMELVEYERFYRVNVDIHGASHEGVSVSIDAGVLTITSEERPDTDAVNGALPHMHSFRYTLALPNGADETGLSIAGEGRLLVLEFDRS